MSAALAIVCFLIGSPLTFLWRRHRAERAAAREAGAYLPRVDAKGMWLTFNGPLTVAAGIVFALLALAEL